MEGRWNDTNRVYPKYLEETLSRSQFVYHKYLPEPVCPPQTSPGTSLSITKLTWIFPRTSPYFSEKSMANRLSHDTIFKPEFV